MNQRTSQIYGQANTLLTFTNTGFRTIQPGDKVLLGYDGNVSAPLYRANFPAIAAPANPATSPGLFYRNPFTYSSLAGGGRCEAPNAANCLRDFVYDAETDSLYGTFEGDNQGANAWTPQFIRVSRANGSLSNTVFNVTLLGAGSTAFYSGTSGTYDVLYPSLPVKIYDNAGTNDVWMFSAGATNTNLVTCNGSTGAMNTNAQLVTGQAACYIPWIKVQNGYGVAYVGAGSGGAGALVGFSVSSNGSVITVGTVQTASMLGIAQNTGTTVAVDLIPLGNNGSFLYFRGDVGAYGTMYVVTLNTGNLTFTINATYALTAVQANYAGRDGSGYILTGLNANNQIVLFQRNTNLGPTIAGALTLLTYSPSTHSLTFGNAVPIVGPTGSMVQIPSPSIPLTRYNTGAHSYFDGYNFYYVETNCHLKIPFTGTTITPQGILAYSKAYAPLATLAGSSAMSGYAANPTAAGTLYIPMFYTTAPSPNSTQYGSGFFVTAEESIDNTFAYGVEIGEATTVAAKGAQVTVSVKSSRLSASVGISGAVGSLSANGAAIYVSPTQLFQIEDFDWVYPRLPSQLQSITATAGNNPLADTTLMFTGGAGAYKSPSILFGPACNGIQNQTATKIQNMRRSVFTMLGVNWYNGAANTSNLPSTASMLFSFDGIFIAQPAYSYVGGGQNYYSGTWDGVTLNRSGNWSFRNEFGFNRYDYIFTSSQTNNSTQLRYQTKD